MAHLVETGGLEALQDAPFLDFIVICKDKQWKVHKTYLCGNSEALVLHCTRMMEGEQGQVRFDEDEPAVIKRFLTYQYIKDYNDVDICVAAPRRPTIRQAYGPALFGFFNTDADQRGIWKCEEEATAISKMEFMDLTQITHVLLLNVRMYALADRFSLTALKQLAVKKLMVKERYFRYCDLDQFLGGLRAITAPDDMDLLYRVFSRCVDNYKVVEATPGAVEVLQQISPLGWKAAVAKAKSLDNLDAARKSNLDRQCDEQEVRINDLKAQLEQEQSFHQSAREELEQEKNKHESAGVLTERLIRRKHEVTRLQHLVGCRKQELKQLRGERAELHRIVHAIRSVTGFMGQV